MCPLHPCVSMGGAQIGILQIHILMYYQVSLKPEIEHQCLLFPYVIMTLSV